MPEEIARRAARDGAAENSRNRRVPGIDRDQHCDRVWQREYRMAPPAHSGTAFSPCRLESFEANDATVITTAISAITMVQMALISGFTPNRTSE